MPAGDRAAQRAEDAGDQHPLQQQVRADVDATLPEAPGEAADDDGADDELHPRHPGFLLHLFQRFAHLGRRRGVVAQVFGQALEVARADHRQHLARARGRFAQARGHVAVALGDDGLVELGRLARELAEARLQHVALLEPLDLVLADLVARQQAHQQARADLRAPPPAQALHRALEGQADVAVDELQGQATRAGIGGGGLELGAGFDAHLLGQPALVGRQRQVGGEQRRLALAQHLDQVHAPERVGIGHGLQALFVEFDRDGVVGAGGDRGAHRVDAGARDVGGAQQRVAHAVAFDDGVGLGGQVERRAGGVGGCVAVRARRIRGGGGGHGVRVGPCGSLGHGNPESCARGRVSRGSGAAGRRRRRCGGRAGRARCGARPRCGRGRPRRRGSWRRRRLRR